MGEYERGSFQGVDQLSDEFPAAFQRVSCTFPTSFLQLVRKRVPEMIPKKLNDGDSLDQDAKLYPQNPSPATRALKPNNPSLKTEQPEP